MVTNGGVGKDKLNIYEQLRFYYFLLKFQWVGQGWGQSWSRISEPHEVEKDTGRRNIWESLQLKRIIFLIPEGRRTQFCLAFP